MTKEDKYPKVIYYLTPYECLDIYGGAKFKTYDVAYLVQTPEVKAVVEEDYDIIQNIVPHFQTDLKNIYDDQGLTLMDIAIVNDDSKMIIFLHSKGLSIDERNKFSEKFLDN